MLQNFKSLWSKLYALAVHCCEWLVASWRRIFGLKTPHKSLRLTRRRDAVRPLVMPGYIAFTREVLSVILKQKKVLFSITAIYLMLYAVLVGIGSQETYGGVVDLFKEVVEGDSGGVASSVVQGTMLFVTVISTGFVESPSEIQQVLGIILFLMLWLSVVWLVRSSLAGKKVRMRDGLYSSGSPIFATIVVVFVIALQLIPVGLAFIGYTAALSSGLLVWGVEAMLFWAAAGLLAILSAYWIMSSLFAMIIITIPGTYPLWAMQASSKMVFGRRGVLLRRIAWMGLTVLAVWVVIVPFAMLLDWGVKSLIPIIDWLPIVPAILLGVMAWSVLWCCVYMYLLYRKVVDNESK